MNSGFRPGVGCISCFLYKLPSSATIGFRCFLSHFIFNEAEWLISNELTVYDECIILYG